MSIIKEIKDISNTVKQLLEKYHHLRDDDYRLIATIWKYEAGGNDVLNDMSANDFLQIIADGKLTNSESIRRSRQKVQENYPELRGKSYRKRKKEGDNFKGQINS